MAVLAIVEDVLFRTKIELAAAQTGTTLTITTDVPPLPEPPDQTSWVLVIIDLNLSQRDAVELVSAVRTSSKEVRILGFCSDIQRELQTKALQAGCTTVLPRSEFVQRLPAMLAGTGSA